jgi:hypothetical protein
MDYRHLARRGTYSSAPPPGLVAHAFLARLNERPTYVVMKNTAPPRSGRAFCSLFVSGVAVGPALDPVKKSVTKISTSLRSSGQRARCGVARYAKQPQEALCVFPLTPPEQLS